MITPAARKMIREQFLNMGKFPNPTAEDVRQCALYMSQILRIGGMRACRQFIADAIQESEVGEKGRYIMREEQPNRFPRG